MNYELFDNKTKRIYLVDMTKESDYYFSEVFFTSIKNAKEKNRKVLIVWNNSWYDKWVLCKSCGFIPQCESCSVSLSFYKINAEEKIWLCNICKRQYLFPETCISCKKQNTFFAYWCWLQKIQEYLKNKFDIDSFQINSKIANSINKINYIYEKISQFDFFVSTNILIQKPNTLNFDLIVILNSDIWLQYPDFDWYRYTFYNLYKFFTKHPTVNYIIQTRNIENKSIRNACAMNEVWFLEFDNNFREKNNYPPFTQMAIIIYKHKIEDSLYLNISKLYKELSFFLVSYKFENIEIHQTPANIYKMFDKYRYHIILKWQNVRDFLDIVVSKLKILERWFKIDRSTKTLKV